MRAEEGSPGHRSRAGAPGREPSRLHPLRLPQRRIKDGAMIREYEPRDQHDLLAAWEAASALAHPFLSQEFQAQVRHDIPNLYLPNAETWVAEEAGRVVGFISLLGNEVGAIFLQPDFHGKGIGRALMDKARDLRGELEVEVFTANEIGRAFYAKYGFELMEAKIHQPSGFEVMRLRLAGRKVMDAGDR